MHSQQQIELEQTQTQGDNVPDTAPLLDPNGTQKANETKDPDQEQVEEEKKGGEEVKTEQNEEDQGDDELDEESSDEMDSDDAEPAEEDK